ncbi:MAG: hypothetical protein OXU79_11235 [Gemmatimonadota bacterium]|nr:hypothetical protein [Gemmatimonadota bacterium]
MDLIRESSFAKYLTRQGIEQGIEKGIEQGVEQGLRESILAVLEIRFDVSASHPLTARIAAVDDAQRLKALHRAAVQVSGVEAFVQLLDQGQNGS